MKPIPDDNVKLGSFGLLTKEADRYRNKGNEKSKRRFAKARVLDQVFKKAPQ